MCLRAANSFVIYESKISTHALGEKSIRLHTVNKNITMELFNNVPQNPQPLNSRKSNTVNNFRDELNSSINAYCSSFFKREFKIIVYNYAPESNLIYKLDKKSAKQLQKKVNEFADEILVSLSKEPKAPVKPELNKFFWRTEKNLFGTRNYIITPDGKAHRVKNLKEVPEKFKDQYETLKAKNQELTDKYNVEFKEYEQQCEKFDQESTVVERDLVQDIANYIKPFPGRVLRSNDLLPKGALFYYIFASMMRA